MKKYLSSALIFMLLLSLTLAGCSSSKDRDVKTGNLSFVANGEDFTREGFVSKDGYDISFDHIYVTLADVAAYQTNPPYDSKSGEEIKGEEKVALESIKTVDLAEGDENAAPILVGKVEAPIGQYNALSFNLVKAPEGDAKDNVFMFVGKAVKDDKTIDFKIKFNEELRFLAGEYVGDERKGIVEEKKDADLEMTFHFDHLFGDYSLEKDDALNIDALGFDSFAQLATDGQVDVNMNDLKEKLNSEDYNKLINILKGLGHVGEGHCHGEIIK